MGIKDLLFGKNVEISDPKLGLLKTKVKNTNPSIGYVWTGETQLAGQTQETVIIMEGNAEGPFKEQLEAIHMIVDSIGEIVKQVVSEALKESKYKATDFYLSAIMPVEIANNSFEVNFEPINDNNNSFISFVWQNHKISEFEMELK